MSVKFTQTKNLVAHAPKKNSKAKSKARLKNNKSKKIGKSLVWEEKTVGAATIVADSRV